MMSYSKKYFSISTFLRPFKVFLLDHFHFLLSSVYGGLTAMDKSL